SATLAGGEEDVSAVARFASDLFGEPFKSGDVILGVTESLPVNAQAQLVPADYEFLSRGLVEPALADQFRNLAHSVGIYPLSDGPVKAKIGHLLKADRRAMSLVEVIRGKPMEIGPLAEAIFGDVPPEQRLPALQTLVTLLAEVDDSDTGATL